MPDYVELRMNPEERLRLVEDNVRDYAIFVVDPDGRIASWNVGAERILGYSEAEAVGMDCAEIFTPEDRAQGAVEAERGKARDAGRAEDERWHKRKDDTRFWGSGIMTALQDGAGRLQGYAKILRDETRRKLAEDERARAEEERLEQERRYAVLQERNRIAQEIHDTLAQSLTAIHLQMEALKDALSAAEKEEAQACVERTQQLARQGLAETRRSVQALRPQLLERRSLVEAFMRLGEEIHAGASLAVECGIHGEPVTLPPHVEDHLLRISQEAVTNVLRHADATHLHMALRFEPAKLVLEIRDNGRGFDSSRAQPGFGLIGLRERAHSIGGQLALTSEAGAGTRIEVTLPLNDRPD